MSLTSLFGSGEVSGCSDLDLDRLAFLICRGGWPETLAEDGDSASRAASDFVDAAIEDVSHLGKRRDPRKVRALMCSYARNQGSRISQSAISSEISGNDTVNVSEETVSDYLQALRRMYVVEDMKVWNPNLRSKTSIRTFDTRFFVDPSLAAASLGIGPQDLMNDLNTMGFIFETLAVRDLRVYTESIDGMCITTGTISATSAMR